MKVRKAIKRIAALGVGATMLGATLMGAMAADLSEYPDMFIDDGKFDGILVVGKKANAVDTIGVTNIALGLQKAAVTKTLVCGSGTSQTTSVTGEKIELEKPGTDLTLGDDLFTVQSVAVDDADLPSLLAEGTFKDNQGDNKEDVDYDQEIDLTDGDGVIDYYFDKDGADPAGVYLKFDKGDKVYTYTLEFKSDLEFADGDDLESTTIEIQGKTYTITDVDVTDDDDGIPESIDKISMMSGESVMWIAQDETVTKEVDGVDHTIKMIDVANDAGSCGFEVDGSSVWIDLDDTETISGLTIGVTDAKEVHNKDYDADICKVFIGAAELELTEANDDAVKIGGDEIEGSAVAFTVNTGVWEDLQIWYEADDDIYLGEGDEWVDPIFGNFKFIVGNVVAENEEIEFSTSSDDGTLTFTSYDDKEVEIPFYMDGNEDDGFDVYLGTGMDSDERYYVEDETIDCGASLEDCDGQVFIGVNDKVIHLIEIRSIDEDENTITLYDLLYNTETKEAEYENEDGSNTISVRGGLGNVVLTIDEAAGEIELTGIDDNEGIFTLNEGEITFEVDTGTGILDDPAFTFTENDDAGDEQETIEISLDADNDDMVMAAPASGGGDLSAAMKKTDDDDDTEMYYTTWGTIVEYDSDAQDSMMIWHPEEELYLEVFMAEAGAVASMSETTAEGCTVSETINPIPATANKFDTEALSMYQSTNLVTVGGPCANTVTAALLGNPEVCWEGFEEGKAMLKLVESGSNVALVVAGGVGRDTQLASRILQDYENYDLEGMEMVATTVSESGLKVEAAPEPVEVVVEETTEEAAEE